MYYFAPSMLSSPYAWQRSPWLYVKWGKPNHYPSSHSYGKSGIWFKLPDREIIICHESERPSQVDEAINLNPFWSDLYSNSKYFLISQGSGKRASPHHKWHHPRYDVIADCVIGSSLILTTEGLLTAKELAVALGHTGSPGRENASSNIRLDSQGKPRKVAWSFVSSPKKVRHIRLSTGRWLKARPNHQLLTPDGMKKISDLVEGDLVEVPLGQNVWASNVPSFEDFDYRTYIAEKYAKVTEYIECNLCGKTFERLESHLFFKHKISGQQYHGIRTGRKGMIRNSLKDFQDLIVPKFLTPDLSRFLGYLIGNGRAKKGAYFEITCGLNREAAEDVLRCGKNAFPNLKLDIIGEEDKCSSTLWIVRAGWSSKVTAFLDWIGAYPKDTKTGKGKRKLLPWCIKQAPKDLVCEFLRGLFDADCGVTGGISLYQAHRRLLEQVQLLLANMGIDSYITRVNWIRNPDNGKIERRRSGVLHINGSQNAIVFKDLIGLTQTHKRRALNDLCKKQPRPRKGGLISLGGKTWDIVVLNKKVRGKHQTYDFHMKGHVEEHHTYVVQGMLGHNSGGAQLRMGSEWIDPAKSIEFMNLTGDIGVCLDLPVRPGDVQTPGAMKKLAETQVKITEFFKRAKRDDLKLLNVAHGETRKDFALWREIVDDPSMFGWAVNSQWKLGVLIGEGFQGHIHCLGLGTLYPALAWAARYLPVVTSDSSTWFSVFRNANVPFQSIPNGSMTYAMMGGSKKFVGHPFHRNGKLACSCAICSRVGWFYPFSMTGSQDQRYLIANHVLQSQLIQATALNRMALEATKVEDYIDQIIKWFGGVSPTNSEHAQKRINGEYDPRRCPLCGKLVEKGKGEFPTCRFHSRLSEYISDILMMEEYIRDPSVSERDLDEVLGKKSSRKTESFGVKELFSGPKTMFAKSKSKLLGSARSAAASKSALPLAEKYEAKVKEFDQHCVCFEPDIRLTEKAPGGNPLEPRKHHYNAECLVCSKPYVLPASKKPKVQSVYAPSSASKPPAKQGSHVYKAKVRKSDS